MESLMSYIEFGIGVYLLLLNIFAFAMYGIDKMKARKGKWRITEASLLWTAFFGGSLGALLGMGVFRHKTMHWNFKILVPLFLFLHVAICFYWWVMN